MPPRFVIEIESGDIGEAIEVIESEFMYWSGNNEEGTLVIESTKPDNSSDIKTGIEEFMIPILQIEGIETDGIERIE